MNPSPGVDFTDRDTQACPFSAYRQLQQQPGLYVDPRTGYYIVTDYQTVKQLTGDNKRLSNQVGIIGTRRDARQAELDRIFAEHGLPIRDVLVSSDPPVHTLHRSLVDKVFTATRLARMESYLRQVVDSYIDRFRDSTSVDFHAEFSIMVPMTVIADQLGLPRTEEDIASFKRWSDAVAFRSEPNVEHESQVRYAHRICELQRFLIRKATEYRAAPADCLLSDIVQVSIDGHTLDMEDLVSIAMILVVAGNETTTSALSSGMLRLLTERGLQDQLRRNPSLIPRFVEETLRMDAPLQGLFRRTLLDMEICGTRVPAGSVLVLKWGAANRDPGKFPEPDRFDINRDNSHQHLTFGFGPHFCVGNQLARNELRFSFEHILRRTTDIRLSNRPDAVVRLPHYTTFGFRHLWTDIE